jgi:hypothetical protein
MRRRGRNKSEEKHPQTQAQKERNRDKDTLPIERLPLRRSTEILIQAAIALAFIGAVAIGILLYYHKQTPAIWTTYATFSIALIIPFLYWQDSVGKKKSRQNLNCPRSAKKSNKSQSYSVAMVPVLLFLDCNKGQENLLALAVLVLFGFTLKITSPM